ncbi:MAG TPA: PA14 domain-containing protein, partial [Bacteroidia bacterium]|nr:PA14 domain-containing protein [Bacteroidia bacterium]
PDCKRFIGGVQYSLLKQEGSIYMVDFLPSGDGNGFTGEYYDDENFTSNKKIRIDPAVNYRWGPPWHDTIVTAKAYSVRWTGYIEPLYSETYSLYTHADKNVSVWINDTLVISSSTAKNKFDEESATINLQAGKKYKLKVEYHNKIENKATVTLYWDSPHQYKQAIPASQLYTDNK